MKIYIAGAITDNPNYREQFLEAERMLTRTGYTVINPVKNDGFTYREYINMGLCELMHCDAIYLLKGYENSTGATLEHDYARTVGLLVFEEKEIEKELRNKAKIGEVWIDKNLNKAAVISDCVEGGYLITYSDGSGGFKSIDILEKYFYKTDKFLNIRSVLNELEGCV